MWSDPNRPLLGTPTDEKWIEPGHRPIHGAGGGETKPSSSAVCASWGGSQPRFPVWCTTFGWDGIHLGLGDPTVQRRIEASHRPPLLGLRITSRGDVGNETVLRGACNRYFRSGTRVPGPMSRDEIQASISGRRVV